MFRSFGIIYSIEFIFSDNEFLCPLKARVAFHQIKTPGTDIYLSPCTHLHVHGSEGMTTLSAAVASAAKGGYYSSRRCFCCHLILVQFAFLLNTPTIKVVCKEKI